MTDLITQGFVPGFRLTDGTDLNALVAQMNLSQQLSGRMVQTFDDFLGDAIAAPWDTKVGSDGAAAFTIGGVSGKLTGTTGAGAGATMAVNGVQFDLGALNWEADQGNLVMEARVKVDVITTLNLFIGFTDQVAALEAPWTLSVVTYTSNQSDGCGFLFDTAATAATVRLVGVSNDVDAANINTGNALVAATWATFRVELSSAGVANFFINGVNVGTLAAASRATIPLVPVIAGFARAAASRVIDCDYMLARQTRV